MYACSTFSDLTKKVQNNTIWKLQNQLSTPTFDTMLSFGCDFYIELNNIDNLGDIFLAQMKKNWCITNTQWFITKMRGFHWPSTGDIFRGRALFVLRWGLDINMAVCVECRGRTDCTREAGHQPLPSVLSHVGRAYFLRTRNRVPAPCIGTPIPASPTIGLWLAYNHQNINEETCT